MAGMFGVDRRHKFFLSAEIHGAAYMPGSGKL